ncbi:MAG: hypothetical protein AB7V62_00575 [Thermoleophilia bacterium]
MSPDSDVAAGSIDAPRALHQRALARVRTRTGPYDPVPVLALAAALLFSIAVWTAAIWAAVQILG